MLAAERLFGERGVEGVTIRELLAAAGQANKSAVHHYFGSKEGLLEAARDMRVPQLEAARARWVEVLPAPGPEQVTLYLAALFLPVLEVMDDAALQSFSRLNLRLLHSGFSDQSVMRLAAASPMTRRIVAGLRSCLPDLPEQLLGARLRLAVGVLLGGVDEWLRPGGSPAGEAYASEAVFWADMLVAASGVLTAPAVSPASALTDAIVRPALERRPGAARSAKKKAPRRSSAKPAPTAPD
jgi:AcrR family transcriptional regulator